MIKHRTEIPDLMKRLGIPLIGAELGVAEGYNSNDLLEHGMEKLYLVDAWATLEGRGDGAFPQEWHDMNFKKTLDRVAKHGDKAVILRGTTLEMAKEIADGSLGLVYLDAAHWYHDVMADLHAWFPKVMKGGMIAGHDYANLSYGVYQAVQDFTRGRFEVHLIRENKPEDAGFLFLV